MKKKLWKSKEVERINIMARKSCLQQLEVIGNERSKQYSQLIKNSSLSSANVNHSINLQAEEADVLPKR